MLSLLSPRVWIALALAGVLAFTHAFVYRAGKAGVRNAWDAQKLTDSEADRKVLETYRKSEFQMAEKSADNRKQADEKVNLIVAQRDDALERLRNRPERPTGPANVPAPACAQPTGSTGAELFRGDAEFLIRFAADADQLRVALESCKAQYEVTRKGTDELRRPD